MASSIHTLRLDVSSLSSNKYYRIEICGIICIEGYYIISKLCRSSRYVM
jgi:hypothetical protein